MGSTTTIIPIQPYEDNRVQHQFAVLNGRRYHYVIGAPKGGPPRATILCVHGFPDLWYGWRYIIPGLLDMGLQVIVPDMIGYGQTDAPTAKTPKEEVALYSWKASAADMKELLRQLAIPKVILFGHDWGGMVVQRIYLRHPEIVTHIITVCTAFRPPIRDFITMEKEVELIPTFKYQLRLQDPQTVKDFESVEAISRFLRAVYRGMGDPGTGSMQVTSDLVGNIGNQAKPKLWSDAEYAYYLEEYSRHGLSGPLNWYKTREQNWSDEKDLPFDKVTVPYMYIGATRDMYTPPTMAEKQGKHIENLTSHEIVATHWVLQERPEAVLQHVQEFLEKVVFGPLEKL